MKAWAVTALILLLLARTAQSREAKVGPSADSLLSAIKAKGPKSVLIEYVSGKGQVWRQVFRKIQTGDPQWLAVAAALRPGSDAGYSEDLNFAVADALLKNPHASVKDEGLSARRNECMKILLSP